ncbi:HPr kinase/phosphorylase [Sphingomonas sp. Leaf343]|uniref:HPr kinase/phosphorylase n=1 Tax=Sphingomonas sp. Leaf343 TaxID=1736345 RepID=UPI0006FB975E|nr:HPr kinase/phosphatase C-terminal domain-containing protein [Sphingomonas sp. Leaf343]KQR83903.1 aldolase [Sphingomonas sp. Leaf343]
MTSLSSETLHATSVAIDGRAVLIEGRSGSGKSDLALRLIDRGAVLVSDDYTVLVRRDGRLMARPPATIAGRIEVRGLGIVPMPHVEDVPVALIVRVDGEVLRMPERRVRRLADVEVPELALAPFEASAPIKLEMALRGGTKA